MDKSNSDNVGKEKFIRFIVENIFKLRFLVVILGLGVVWYIAFKVDQNPRSELKDIISVITGGCVILALFYSIITYEYNQRKFSHEVKNSKETLSFTAACEWYKPPISDYMRVSIEFFRLNRQLIEENNAKVFHDTLEDEKNTDAKKALFSILNYLESISLGVKQGIMDEDFIKGFFNTVFENYYNDYLFYIEYRRRVKHNQRIWKNFTSLSNKWLNG